METFSRGTSSIRHTQSTPFDTHSIQEKVTAFFAANPGAQQMPFDFDDLLSEVAFLFGF